MEKSPENLAKRVPHVAPERDEARAEAATLRDELAELLAGIDDAGIAQREATAQERDLARCRAGAEELRASIRRQGEELDRVHVALADALRLVHQLTAPGPLRRIARRLVSLVTP